MSKSRPGTERWCALPKIPRATGWLSPGIFLLFFVYFAFTGHYLPAGAGPDYGAHQDTTLFIYREGRLPVLPEDAEKLDFSPRGTTRALRPPASYLTSALVARALPNRAGLPEQRLHLGSALLCALAVTAVFLATSSFLSSLWLGLLGTALFGLLPQLVFIASYVNDDSAAILAGTLLVSMLIVLYRWGINRYTVAALGAVAGFTVASKFTAWLVLPFTLAYALLNYRASWRRMPVYLGIFLIPFLVFGGWWLLFNIYHYGFGDPLQFEIIQQTIQAHTVTSQYANGGYAAQGLGYRELLIDNHMDFIGATFRSMIGHLDQLRLTLGWLEYGFYLIVVLCGISYYLLQAIKILFFTARPRHKHEHFQRFVLESFLVAVFLFQIFMYVQFNLHHDIQVQGKYLLPAFFPLVLLFLSAVQRALYPVYEWLRKNGYFPHSFPAFIRLITLSGTLCTVAIHAHAIRSYALPFYYPPEIQIEVQNFRPYDLGDDDIIKGYQNMTLDKLDTGWQIRVTKRPAHLILKAEICRLFEPASLLKIRLRANHAGRLKLYLDNGEGFEEKFAIKANYTEGENALIFGLKKSQCRRLLVEPMVGRGELLIEEIAVAPARIPLH